MNEDYPYISSGDRILWSGHGGHRNHPLLYQSFRGFIRDKLVTFKLLAKGCVNLSTFRGTKTFLMSLVSVFIQNIEPTDPAIAKRFKGKLQARQRDKSIQLIVHVFHGASYTIDELQELQNVWSTFVPAAYTGFTAAPLSVVGEVLHTIAIESGWTG